MSPQSKKPKDQDEPERVDAAAETPDDTQAEAEAVEIDATTTTPGEAPAEASGGEAGGERSETETVAETTGVDKAGAEAAAVSEPVDEAPVAPKRRRSRAKAKPEPEAETEAAEEAPAEPEKPAPAARRRDQPRPAGEAVVVRAQARYVRSSARKARLVCDNVRGKSVVDARAILAFSPRNVAEAWTKLLESAVANAENNHDLDGDDLKIVAIYADEGPTIKRFRPRAMGRATQIKKRTSHLSIQLTTKD